MDSSEGKSKKSTSARTGGRKKLKKVPQGIVHVMASFNNTKITITDLQGNCLISASAGAEGFSGSRKSTPFAAQVAAEKAGTAARDLCGMSAAAIYLTGPGPGREAVIRTFVALGFKIVEIRDSTGIPHNGPRPRKKRRV